MKAAAGLRAEKFCPVKGQPDIVTWAILLGERGRGRELTPVIVDPSVLDERGNVTGIVEIGATRSGKPKIVRGNGEPLTWLDRVCTLSSYVRGACGWVGKLPDSSAKLIAVGWGAFGDAGRIGSWADILLSVPGNTWLRVKPSRGPAYFRWYPEVETGSDVVNVDAESLDAFAEAMGILAPPVEKEAWVEI
jgi:hypothetical protein